MGWASYLEDNISRYGATSRARGEPKRINQPAHKAAKKSPKREPVVSKLKEFTASTARPLPVLLLADVSGSMSVNGKIDALNDAVEEMIETFGGEDDSRAEIHVAVITFGNGVAKLHRALTPA